MRTKASAKATKKFSPIKTIFLVAVLVLFVSAVANFVQMQVEIEDGKQQLEYLQTQINRKLAENKELEMQLSQGVNSEYIERSARDNLDMVYPDEKVFVDIAGS
jgi:cell division protein FtsL